MKLASRPLVLLLLGWALSGAAALQPVHVAFLTDCTMYSNWQSLGMIFSFNMSGQPGTVTRVMCCTPEEKEKYDKSLLKEVETHIAPSFTIHPKTKDNYAAYNKPEAVIDWLEHVTPEEDYVLVLDSDMIQRRPFLVEDMGPKPGLAIGARYTYMIGVNNELAMRHIPEIAPRNDTLAGPKGRRADMVGGFFFVHRDDLKRMSHDWLKFTEDVRADPMAYKYSGDVYAIHPGDKPWISEMYGYAFGAAKANLWHKWDGDSMIYPEYEPHGIPKVMHYGLFFQVDNYKFDKHWHYDFDVTQCPPWDLSNPKHRVAGVFEHPPRPGQLKTKEPITQYFRDLLSVETVATLNAAFCDYHLKHCPPSQQLLDECTTAWDIYKEVTAEARKVEEKISCQDFHPKCPEWSKAGECEKNVEFMAESCKKSCKVCNAPRAMSELRQPVVMIEENLKKVREALASKGTTETAGLHLPTTDTTSTKPVVIPHTDQPGQDEKSTSAEEKAAAEKAKEAETRRAERALREKKEKEEAEAKRKEEEAKKEKEIEAEAARLREEQEKKAKAEEEHQRRQKEGQKAQKAATGGGANSSLSRKELVVKCYRMSLTLDEVKECVAAAKEGHEYQAKRSPPATEEQKVASTDNEDLTLTASPVKEPSDKVVSEEKTITLPKKHAGLSTWQAVLLWLVVIAGVLALVPRLLRMRRRPRSGMRSE